MLVLNEFIENCPSWLMHGPEAAPWKVIENLEQIILKQSETLSAAFEIKNNIAIHKKAIVEEGAILKGPMIISENCFIAAHAYLRGPLYLGNGVKIGPCCEIKQSVILDHSSIAHLNYVGNSFVGKEVNLEAGAVCANHYNERKIKDIFIKYNDEIINIFCHKFGALLGDGVKIGANAVLSPGTLLKKNEIVNRLTLVEQVPE